jgi:transcriptional regulator with XRE-family HTH domain
VVTGTYQPSTVDDALQQKRWDKATSRAVGEELRRAREANGWSREYLVKQLPSGVGARTLLSYEHGTRHLTLLRFIEVCRALGTASSTLLQRALQRAQMELDTLPLRVDLYALVLDESGEYPLLVQWAHNTLAENPDGVVEVEPAVVRNLALCFGCDYGELTRYLAGFLVEEMDGNEGEPWKQRFCAWGGNDKRPSSPVCTWTARRPWLSGMSCVSRSTTSSDMTTGCTALANTPRATAAAVCLRWKEPSRLAAMTALTCMSP